MAQAIARGRLDIGSVAEPEHEELAADAPQIGARARDAVEADRWEPE